jgi:polyhydroxybutyrate depolymerase
MKSIILSLGFIGFSLLASAQTNITKSFVHGGITRTYQIYVPAIYNSSQPVPLVFNLHGYTSNATQQALYGNFKPIADTANFILVHPEGSIQPGTTNTQYWNIGIVQGGVDDVDFIETLIDSVSAHYNINPRRIYSAGMSNGGFMGYMLACESNRFAAIGSVTGSMTLPMYTSCNPARPIPTMQIHGTNDPTVSYNGSALNQGIEDVVDLWVGKNNCNTTPAITAVPNTVTSDGATAERYLYTGGTNGHTVEFFKVTGGEHTWPGAIIPIGVTCMDFSASIELWRFFSQYESPATSSISEFGNELQFTVWPNPAIGQISVQIPNKEITQLSILDMQGRVVYKTQQSNITTVDIHDIPSGNYIIQISGDDFVANKKLVVR